MGSRSYRDSHRAAHLFGGCSVGNNRLFSERARLDGREALEWAAPAVACGSDNPP